MHIGVLVPVHGFAPFLAEALDSILDENQVTGTSVSVVVVDDGSDPPLRLHPDHAAAVTLVRRDSTGGPANARAAGLEALGEVDLVALCDADDAWEAGKLAAQVGALAARPDAGVCFGPATIVGVDGRPTGERWPEPAELSLDTLYAANPVPTSSVVMRRSALEAAGGFAAPVRVAEDWDLWLRIARAGWSLIAEPAGRVRYRRHPGGLTADVEALAAAQRIVHERHAAAVAEATRVRVARSDARAQRAIRWRRRLGRGRATPYA